MNELLTKLESELFELNDKRSKLFKFMRSDEYAELPPVHKGLLMVQSRFMNGYIEVLQDRIQLIADEEK